MRIPLVPVGSTPPRYVRGRTFLPDGLISPLAWWGMRIVFFLAVTVIAPFGALVGAWWGWGLRRRMWRWYVPTLGLLTIPALPYLVHAPLSGGIAAWTAVLALTPLHVGTHHITGGAISVAHLASSAWITGTVAGTWMSFLAWYRTPPWRDRDRPKTVFGKRRERALVRALEAGAGDVNGVITFGIDSDTGKPVELPWKDTDGHLFITGAPGTGKTTSALKVVRAAIRDGMFTAVVDMKGSPKMVEQIALWTARWNRPLWVFSAEGPSRYDPFNSGDYNRKRDLLMATSQWSEAHYQAKAADYLLTVFYVLDILGAGHVTIPGERSTVDTAIKQRDRGQWVRGSQSWLHTVADMLNPNLFQAAVALLPADHPRSKEAALRAARVLDDAQQDPKALSGLGPRVRSLTDTVLGEWVKPGEPNLTLMDAWNQGGVVIFSLPTLTYPEGAAAFGGLAVQDLKTLAGELQDQGNTKPGLVFVDEFATLGAHNVTSALAMARESGLRWMLATQDLGDLAVGDDGKAFVQKILTDTNVKIIHGVGDPETAKRLAELAGMRWGIQERTAINQSNSTLDITSGTQSGHGFIDRRLVAAIEPNDILHQGAGAESRFVLLNKPGMYAVTGSHTIIDKSVWQGQTTAPQYLPARYLSSGVDVVSEPVVGPLVVEAAVTPGDADWLVADVTDPTAPGAPITPVRASVVTPSFLVAPLMEVEDADHHREVDPGEEPEVVADEGWW